MARDITETDRFVLFWDGWPSQWHPSRFVLDGQAYNCCEQYMMAEKARVFGDDQMLANVLASDSPRAQKAFGRQVRGFDAERWNAVCRGVVYAGNLAKFGQNDGLRKKLLATGDRTIVEASPADPIWGIGLAQDDPRALDPAQWRGTNWLGIAVMQVRTTLRGGPLDDEIRRQLDARRQAGTVAAADPLTTKGTSS